MTRDILHPLLEKTLHVLETESSSYRPASPVTGFPGGLLDFCTQVPPVPTLVVPDLHARAGFLADVLAFKPVVPETMADGSLPVMTLLGRGGIRVVCVGDGLHSELHKARWLEAFDDFEGGIYSGEAITQEMTESLALMEVVMRCKCAFPEFFHFLKGNHENILNTSRHGNHPFRKFAQEGEMVRLFMSDVYGEETLHMFAYMENALPLCAVCPGCLISHAEPLVAYSREQLVEGLDDDEVIEGLTWTSNGDSEPGSVETMLSSLLPESPYAVYFGGHRPVADKYELRQNGKFVQIHNPRQQNVALVSPWRPFVADKDIIRVK